MRRIPHLIKLSGLLLSILTFGLLQSCSPRIVPTSGTPKQVNCTELDCEDTLYIIIDGSKPRNYTVEASDQEGNLVSIHCVTDEQHLRPTADLSNPTPDGQSLCGAAGPHLVGFAPDVVNLTFYWDDHIKNQTFRPVYGSFQPNGPDCNPTCRISAVTIHIP